MAINTPLERLIQALDGCKLLRLRRICVNDAGIEFHLHEDAVPAQTSQDRQIETWFNEQANERKGHPSRQ